VKNWEEESKNEQVQIKLAENQWECEQCTFINEINWENPIARNCAVCGMENELKAQRKQEPPAKQNVLVASISKQNLLIELVLGDLFCEESDVIVNLNDWKLQCSTSTSKQLTGGSDIIFQQEC